MSWKFWERGPRGLSRPLKEYLLRELHLAPEQIKNLYCRRKSGKFAGRNVTYVDIFNPALPEKILFVGYTERDGSVILKRVEN
jgi:hypothetical protein